MYKGLKPLITLIIKNKTMIENIELIFYNSPRINGTLYLTVHIKFRALAVNERANLLNNNWYRRKIMYRNIFNPKTGDFLLNFMVLGIHYKRLTTSLVKSILEKIYKNPVNTILETDEINLIIKNKKNIVDKFIYNIVDKRDYYQFSHSIKICVPLYIVGLLEYLEFLNNDNKNQ